MAQRQLILEISAEVAIFSAEKSQKIKVIVTDSSADKRFNDSKFKNIYRFLLSCKIANTFHIVVKSKKRYHPGEEIEVMVTDKGRAEGSGEACLYGSEVVTFELAERVKENEQKEKKELNCSLDEKTSKLSVKSQVSSNSSSARKRATVNEDFNETLYFDSDSGEKIKIEKSKKRRKSISSPVAVAAS